MHTPQNRFPLELIPEIIAHPENYRVQSVVPYTRYNDEASFPIILKKTLDSVQSVVFLELSATGTRSRDVILEIVAVRCSVIFEKDELISIDALLHQYEAPHFPIPSYVTRQTGLTNQMLGARTFNVSDVKDIFADDPVVISTRGTAYRDVFEKRFSSLSGLRWVNSTIDIPWGKLNSRLDSKENLALNCSRLGYFFNYANVLETALSNLWFFHYVSGAVKAVADALLYEEYLVWAVGASFEVKDELKFSGYRWDRDKKCWYKHVKTLAEVEEEKVYLSSKCADSKLIQVEVIGTRKNK